LHTLFSVAIDITDGHRTGLSLIVFNGISSVA